MSKVFSVLLVKGQNTQFDYLSEVIEDFKLAHHSVDSSWEAVEYCARHSPALVLLDMQVDQRNALDIIQDINNLDPKVQCTQVVFSARKENYVQITALNAGADDFLVKPVNRHVFASRLNAWLRTFEKQRAQGSNKKVVKMTLDNDRFLAIVKDQEIPLQRKEYEIIALLVTKPKKVFSRKEIKTAVWIDANVVRDRTIDVHIRNLRIKLGPKHIKTYKGIGYSYIA